MNDISVTNRHPLESIISACRCCCGLGRIKRWQGTLQTMAIKKMFSKILFTPHIGRQVSPAPASLCERTGVDFPKRAKSRGSVFWTAGPPYLKGCPVYIWHQRLMSALPKCPENRMERKMTFHTSLKNSIQLTLSSSHLGLLYPGNATKKGEGQNSQC